MTNIISTNVQTALEQYFLREFNHDFTPGDYHKESDSMSLFLHFPWGDEYHSVFFRPMRNTIEYYSGIHLIHSQGIEDKDKLSAFFHTVTEEGIQLTLDEYSTDETGQLRTKLQEPLMRTATKKIPLDHFGGGYFNPQLLYKASLSLKQKESAIRKAVLEKQEQTKSCSVFYPDLLLRDRLMTTEDRLISAYLLYLMEEGFTLEQLELDNINISTILNHIPHPIPYLAQLDYRGYFRLTIDGIPMFWLPEIVSYYHKDMIR